MTKTLRHTLTIVMVGLILLSAAACGSSGTATSTSAPSTSRGTTTLRPGTLNVVVSLPVFVSMAEAVGGDHVTVRSIVPAGADAHTYQPSPSDVQAIADAQAILVNGAGLEEWMSGLIESAGGAQAPVYELAEGIDAGTHDDHAHDESESTPSSTTAESADDHEHEGGNPHYWLDPGAAIHYAERIAQAFSERDPAHAAEYEANAERYIEEIEAFDAWAKEQIATIPADQQKLVTFHDAFPHFAEHYGLQIVGVVVKSPGREPSAREVAELVDEIRAQNVKAVFTEPQFNPKLAQTIADEAGVEMLPLYSDSPVDHETYLEMMRRNVNNIVEGLT